jgi:hypothetical protein
MFDKMKKWFTKGLDAVTENDLPVEPKPKTKKPRKEQPVLSEKEKATAAGEPYVNVVSMEIDPNDINTGAFELDFNDKFVLNLIRAGYKIRDDDTDAQIVERWFQTVARNIAMELYEQQQADPDNRYRNEMRVVQSRDLGDGRSEVS